MIDPEFAEALEKYGLEVDPGIAEALQTYAQVMWRHNEQINLTRHTTWDLFVGRDLRDCLQIASLIEADEEVLDLGSGNGIPGIPLAIMRDDVDIALAESVGKRAKVLDEIIAELGLPIAVYAARGEDILDDFRFSTIVSRAAGSIHKVAKWLQPHWASIGRVLLIKGPKWVSERGEARHQGTIKGLDLRVVARYPLGKPDDESEQDAGEGVVLQLSPELEA
ncbi:MAG: 16S rRNA (guanine(527)-N(7))-methyltransferase RsmG [Planctomycetota bacterium]